MQHFTWVGRIAKGWTLLAWWVVLPVRVLALLLDIIANAVLVGLVAGVISLYLGWIPDSAVKPALDNVGRRVEALLLPDLKRAISNGPSGTVPGSATVRDPARGGLHAPTAAPPGLVAPGAP